MKRILLNINDINSGILINDQAPLKSAKKLLGLDGHKNFQRQMIKYRQPCLWRCRIPFHSSLDDAHSSLEELFIDLQLGATCRPPQQGCGFSRLALRCVPRQQSGSEVWRKDVIPGWDCCTKNVPCCRCSCTAKLFVRVLVECSVSCWEGNARRADYSDAILLAKVFRYCAAAHHNSLIKRWSFRFHCR